MSTIFILDHIDSQLKATAGGVRGRVVNIYVVNISRRTAISNQSIVLL